MAYDYNKALSIWKNMTAQQKADYMEKNKNDASFIQFQNDLRNNSTAKTVSTPTNTSSSNSVITNPQNTVLNNSSTTIKNPTSSTSNAFGYKPPQTNASNDFYWDTSWATNRTQYKGTNTTGTNNYQYDANLTLDSIKNQNRLWWNDAIAESQRTWQSYLPWRNNTWANALYNAWITDAEGIKKVLSQYSSFANFFEEGQNNTVQAIMNRIWELQNQINQQKNNWWAIQTAQTTTTAENRGTIGILGTDDPTTGWDYLWNVDRVLRESQWFGLEEMKRMYPEEYEKMMPYIMSQKGVRDATDPASRKQLDWVIQYILWVWVWYGSDMSVLKRYEEAINSKFKNPDQVTKDMQDVINLRTRWMSNQEIANQLGMSEDQVNQLVLLANWDSSSRAWDYYALTDVASKQITEEYDIQMARNNEEKQIALDRANQQAQWAYEDYKTNLERQQKVNEINSHNAHMMASVYWFAFSDKWLQGLQYVGEQGQNMIDDIIKNYDRTDTTIAQNVADIIRNWQWNNDDLIREGENALRNAINYYLSQTLANQEKYGIMGMEAQQAFTQWVQNFITQAEKIYNDALTRQQNNLTTLMNNIANLSALQAQNMTLRNTAIQQFQTEALNMNSSQLQSLANQLWLWGDIQTLQNYQVQASVNYLNSIQAGAGAMFQGEIENKLKDWFTPMQAISQVMNSAEYKAKYGTTTDNDMPWAMSDWQLYNKKTGQLWQNVKNTATVTWSNGVAMYDSNGKLYTYDWDDRYLGSDWQFHQVGSQTQWTDGAKSSDYIKMEDENGNQVLVNPLTKEIITPEELFKNKKDNQTITNFKNWLSTSSVQFAQQYWVNGTTIGQTWEKGGQCWTFVNDYLNSLGIEWRVFGSTLDSKIKAITPGVTDPVVGSIVVMDTSATVDVSDGNWGTKKVKAGHVGIVTQVNNDWTMLVTDSNRKPGSETVMTHKVSVNNKNIKWYYVPGYDSLAEQLTNNNTSNEEGATVEKARSLADIWLLTKQIFWGNASDKDRALIEQLVSMAWELWWSRQQILYEAWWYRINDNANKEFANTLMSYMEKHTDKDWWLAGTYDLSTIANRINSWDLTGAIQNMETQMIDEFWGAKTSQATSMAMVDKLSRIYSSFQKIKGLTGKFSLAEIITNYWWWSSWLSNMLGLTDEQTKTVASVATQIQNVYAEIRNQLAWTAVTENESKWLSAMIPSLKDNSTVFETKIKEAVTNIYKDQNGARNSLGLPKFTNLEQLMNWDKRVELYWGTTWNTTWTKIQ